MTRDKGTWMVAVAVVVLVAASASAQAPPPIASPESLGLFVYPANNQDKAQQQKDEGECYAWARQETSIDPLAPPAPPQQAQEPAKQGPDGSALKGAAKGAATGAAIADIAGEDTSEGAGKGAARRKRQDQGKEAAAAGSPTVPTASAAAGSGAGSADESHVQQGPRRLSRGPGLQCQVGQPAEGGVGPRSNIPPTLRRVRTRELLV